MMKNIHIVMALVVALCCALVFSSCFKGTQPKTSGTAPTAKPTGAAPGTAPTDGVKPDTVPPTAEPAEPAAEPGTPATDTTPAEPGAETPAPTGWTGNAQDFEVTGFDGATFKISEKFAGKPLVLNFWAAWCGPCVGEFPDFQQVYNAKKDQFNMLSVAVDDRSDPKGFVAKEGYNWNFAHDTDGAKRYNVQGVPRTLFISATGEIVADQLGGMTKELFEEHLAKLLTP